MHIKEDPIIYMSSNFQVDICILNTILMLANFGPGIGSRVLGIGSGFYSSPKIIFYENQYLLSSVFYENQ